MKITKKEAWSLLSNTENSLLGASNNYTLDQIIGKLQVFEGDTFNNSRNPVEVSSHKIKFSDGSTLFNHDFSNAYKYGDYLILEKEKDFIIYQTF